MQVFRTYTEKKPGFATDAARLCSDIRTELGIAYLSGMRILNRYDIEGIEPEYLENIRRTVFGEPAVDFITDEMTVSPDDTVIAVSYLPGQFDQRADSCEQCVQLITCGARPKVKNARIYVFSGNLSDEDKAKIRKYLINPVDSHEVGLEKFSTLTEEFPSPDYPEVIESFCNFSSDEAEAFLKEKGLAMDIADLEFCKKYYSETEKRDPTITEIRIIDTYWSDHCRHTTFSSRLDDVKIEDERVKEAYDRYLEMRRVVYGEKAKTRPITLMDIATIGGKYLKKTGLLNRLDESEEINACSVKIRPTIGGEKQDWLLMFKNETHNHPTEIEPFGGAATCLGGAIRDPLAGRAYCYQAMRVTGAADPTTPYEKTIPNKLPQRKLCLGAASGFSSYGNQIGLATGIVSEIYHPGYAAKRLETGAIIAAVPAKNVARKVPEPGDIVLLVGGRTGRDGCGGATGSSKAHNTGSLASCGAEVQKGNPPEERKIQRLFRNPECALMIKRCNDFGAGGVSVAIGELADGLDINLDAVTKKYEGLDATELAISESQERMAVVVSPENAARFAELAACENLEATVVAKVTDEPRMRMLWRGRVVANLTREFMNSNGAPKFASVFVKKPDDEYSDSGKATFAERLRAAICNLNAASQKGLVERFDSTIGAGTVFMPFGGKNRLTPQQTMVGLLPSLQGATDDCSLMSYGFEPYASAQDAFSGAEKAVISSVAKLVACGAKLSDGLDENCWLSMQEFFPSPRRDPERWALPFCALLGALMAQIGLGIAAIGGKDSMSGSFESIDVPPTLISFAVSASKAEKVISPEFKAAGNGIWLIVPPKGCDYGKICDLLDYVSAQIESKRILSAYSISDCSAAEAMCKMAFGNSIGVKLDNLPEDELFFKPVKCGFIVEAAGNCELNGIRVGKTDTVPAITTPDGDITLSELQKIWEAPLATVYPTTVDNTVEMPEYKFFERRFESAPAVRCVKPNVFIPVFPGTNCEYDLARRFSEAGAEVNITVLRNLTAADVEQSVQMMVKGLSNAQILALPGGFSGGDEPDGSGKFITAFFNNPDISAEIERLLYKRDGLAIGICNGFQALIKLGLVPGGHITPMTDSSPTLTYNNIGRHQSMPVRLKVMSVASPWMKYAELGQTYTVPISHGEGRFCADPATVSHLFETGCVATCYADEQGNPTMKMPHNPNGSAAAIEGITSPDGRIFGKMGHDERCGANLLKNVGGSGIRLFAAGVDYFKGN